MTCFQCNAIAMHCNTMTNNSWQKDIVGERTWQRRRWRKKLEWWMCFLQEPNCLFKYFAYIISPAFCATNPCIYAKSKCYNFFKIFTLLCRPQSAIYTISQKIITKRKELTVLAKKKVYIDLMMEFQSSICCPCTLYILKIGKRRIGGV